MEREAREDRGLLRGVVSLDIRRRIGLGIAQALGVGEHLGEVGALGVHAVEDVVRGAVHDAHDASHAVTREGVTERTDDRDRPGRGGLVIDGCSDLVGRVVDLRAVGCEQGLVGRDDIRTG